MYNSLPEHLRPKETFAGSIDPAFLYADNRTADEILRGRWWQCGVSDSERHRLVEGLKSPTAQTEVEKRIFNGQLAAARLQHAGKYFADGPYTPIKAGATLEEDAPFSEVFTKPEITPLESPGTKTVVERREWADEIRVRTQTDAINKVQAPEGPRESTELSMRGARAIADSCAYLAMERGGYSTFATMTLRPEARAALSISASAPYCLMSDRVNRRAGRKPNPRTPVALHCRLSDRDKPQWHGGREARPTSPVGRYCKLEDKPEGWGNVPVKQPSKKNDKELRVSIQKELSRCMDNWQKIYQRGGYGESLDYCWVVEIPKNDKGEDNPHVHILMRWRVPYVQFEGWANRLEKVWGMGFATLEKLKDPEAAGAYMAKAAGYITKGNGDDSQGSVRGNRYGISESARAPGWEKLSESQLHVMGQLIREVYDHVTDKHGADYGERKRLNHAREVELKAGKAWAEKNPGQPLPENMKKRRAKIGERLQKVRKKIKSIPVRASKYQLVLKGKLAAFQFFNWAKSDTGFSAVDWLPEKPEGMAWEEGRAPEHADKADIHALRRSQVKRSPAEWREIRMEKQRQRNAADHDVNVSLIEKAQQFVESAIDGWREYFNLGWGYDQDAHYATA